MTSSQFDMRSFVAELLSGVDFVELLQSELGRVPDHDPANPSGHWSPEPGQVDDVASDGPVFEPHPYELQMPGAAKPEGNGGGNSSKETGGGSGGGGGGKGKPTSAPTDIALSSTDIEENSAGGAEVGQLSATDSDKNDSFTYRLTDSAGGLFAINGDTLVVADGAVLDYESSVSHSITVEVTDKYGNTYVKTFDIAVNNIVEGVNRAPTDISLDSTNVVENAANGAVVGVLDGTDPDTGDALSFSLTDDAGGRFAIDGNQLVVADGSLLDFEGNPSHSVTVMVTDSSGASYTEQFTITVDDVLEAENQAPTDISLDSTNIVENAANGAVVGVLDGTDPDAGDALSFSLTDDAGGRFTINGDQLVVADGSLLDFEINPSHSVTVMVTDSSGASYTEQFTIAVTDVYEGVQEKPYYVSALIPQASNGEEYYRWNYGDDVGTSVVVTFTFLDDFASYYDPANMYYTNYTNDPVAFEAFTAEQVLVAYQLLAEISEFANVTFVEVGSAEEADITFGAYLMDSGIGAYAYYAGGSTYSGDVWMNTRYDTEPTTSEDGGADWARSALAHEIGHAMGLQHPGDYDAGSGGTGELYLPPEEDNGQFTIMSYTDYPYSSYDPVDYMLYDIAAMQYLYGANTSHATGDDVYEFDEYAKYIDTIWDAGGFDTFSAASANGDVTLDLNEGAFSSVGLIGNIGIAFGAEIEAAIGGAGDDTLIGNDLDNVLEGGDGADWLFGGAGSDKFVFDEADGMDLIADFEDGVDLIDLSGTALTYDALGFYDGASGVDIVFGDTTVTLADASVNQIGEDDFLFAGVA